jgi:two-component system CheB/CheR fusion protein
LGIVALALGLVTWADVRQEREFLHAQIDSRELADDASVNEAVDQHIAALIRVRVQRGLVLGGVAIALSYVLAALLTRLMAGADADLRAEMTERKRAERALLESRERFSMLFKYNPVAMALVGFDGRYLAVNGRLAEMLGRAPDDMLDLAVFDVTDPEYGHWALDLPPSPRDVSYMETRYITGDGSGIWVGVNTAIASDPDDEPVFAITTVQDVSGRKREQTLEKRYLTALELHASEFRERYEEAERLRRSLEEENTWRKRFLSVLSHELRTPLTPILSSGQMLEELLRSDPRSGEGRLIENLLSGARTLKSRIDDLIDQASYEAGQYQIETESVDVLSIVRSATDLLRPEADSRGQPLELELGESLPIIEADGKRLKQALVNLVANALKFGPDERPVVVRAFIEDEFVVFEVQDYGPGIPPDDVPHLFMPYFRREHDRRQHRGLGLGLTIVKQIVRAHGGEVGVESAPGEGALFRIRIPVSGRSAASKLPEALPSASTAARPEPDQQARRS